MPDTGIITQLPNPSDFEQETLHFLKGFQFKGHKPSLEHITAVSRYFSRLPYENISKIIKHGQTDDQTSFRLPDELTEDHYAWHLGGTCFSLTYFLTGIYTILGYETQPLICDLNWGANNHSVIMINFAGKRFLVDPGYMIFTPLPLLQETVRTRLSAETGVELRYLPATDTYALYTFRKGQYVRRYRFIDRAISVSEFAQYWQASFELPGMDDLTLTKVKGFEMTYIQGDFIKITSPTLVEKTRERNQAEKLIRDRFGIPLEKVEEARQILRMSGKHQFEPEIIRKRN
ncbi:MAG: arylamine N-acetyltransferase [Candidatus Marinimicrobia bacterium]|nr:arylamine N-acetyltransferase [Candidatus Neomarinimicrobiota bacterium]